ncbi:hypothetical protein DPMN_085192 [Dreissena polymorpha]|uniref:Uncharacterized protein n=1 Tax=Dreissena polymorpha TaxID=45954 RepID=A0A9D4BCN2_DREPO|nr:hypothetical protein DPMN_085192 [Dreissena polymorpha]
MQSGTERQKDGRSDHYMPSFWGIQMISDVVVRAVTDIIKTNVLTKFYEDWTINVTMRVFTNFYFSHIRKNALLPGSHASRVLTIINCNQTINVASRVLTRKNAPPHCGNVSQATGTIFQIVQDFIRTNILTKVLTRFYYGHVFQPTATIFELVQDIIGINFLDNKYRTINVASRLLTRQIKGQQTTHDGQWAITKANHANFH